LLVVPDAVHKRFISRAGRGQPVHIGEEFQHDVSQPRSLQAVNGREGHLNDFFQRDDSISKQDKREKLTAQLSICHVIGLSI